MKRIHDFEDLSVFTEPKRPKIDKEEVLDVVFRFKHKEPSDRQDEALCKTLVKHFAMFVANLNPVTVSDHSCGRVNPLVDDRIVPVSDFAVHEVEILREICHRLETAVDDIHKRGDIWHDPWLPMYGCTLQRTKVSAAVVKLEVIFVDGWERTLHFLSTGKCVHSAVSKTYHVLHCADLDSSLEEKFGSVFDRKLRKAQQSKGSQRSAHINNLGHQKTPQFIAAVVRRAVAVVTSMVGEDEDVSGKEWSFPHGGTTDVGQHTGGRPRDTCWPLVLAAIAHNICCGRGIYRKTMVMFQLSLLQTEIEGIFGHDIGVHDGCDIVDKLFFMLQVVVQNTVELLELGYDVSSLQDECASLRASIDEFVDAMNHKTAVRYRLLDSAKMQHINRLTTSVELESPKRSSGLNTEENNEERHLRVLANLERCWFVDGMSCSLEALLEWEKSNSASKSYKCILVQRIFEKFMFERSLKLTGEDIVEHPDDDDEMYVGHIKSLVTTYQKVVSEWRQLPQTTSVLGVEQRSRELLVMWIACCLVHQKCVNEVPLCAEYNIALNWQDLKVAVLSDRAAISALQRVARYIRGWNEKTRGLELFHLIYQEPTFSFGCKFGLNSSEMMETYNHVVETWEALEEDLQSKQRELNDENARLNAAYPPRQYAEWYRKSGAKAQFTADINKIKSQLKKTKSSLEKVLMTPPPLIRPLPALKDDAITVIFMLTMPRNLEILGSLVLTAHRALAPVEVTAEMKNSYGLSFVTWQQFYDQYAPSQVLRATTIEFTATPGSCFRPERSGPQTVDGLTNIDQFRSECVVNPILQGTALTWMTQLERF